MNAWTARRQIGVSVVYPHRDPLGLRRFREVERRPRHGQADRWHSPLAHRPWGRVLGPNKRSGTLEVNPHLNVVKDQHDQTVRLGDALQSLTDHIRGRSRCLERVNT